MFVDPDGLCREVGALLTWIDCGNPDCPTSSLRDPERYRAGYNNPKHIDSQRYYEEQAIYNDTISIYPFRDFVDYSRSDDGRKTLRTMQAGYNIIHGVAEGIGGVVLLLGEPSKLTSIAAIVMIIGGIQEVKSNVVEIILIWGE